MERAKGFEPSTFNVRNRYLLRINDLQKWPLRHFAPIFAILTRFAVTICYYFLLETGHKPQGAGRGSCPFLRAKGDGKWMFA